MGYARDEDDADVFLDGQAVYRVLQEGRYPDGRVVDWFGHGEASIFVLIWLLMLIVRLFDETRVVKAHFTGDVLGESVVELALGCAYNECGWVDAL